MGARLSALLLGAIGAACAPALDWREVRPAGTAVRALLPCKATGTTRTVTLAGETVRVAMLACKADAWTWAIATADVSDPARVGSALRALGDSTVANVRGHVVSRAPVAVPGATPHDAQAVVQVSGRFPEGAATNVQFVVFSHGTQVFQAIVMGEPLAGSAAEPFFDSLRVAP